MTIKSKDDGIYYLASIMCAQIEVVEKIVEEGVAPENKKVYDSRIQFIFALKDKLKVMIKQA